MLDRENRLKKTKDFAVMATKGRSIYGVYSTLRVRKVHPSKEHPKPAEEPPKIGFIISTKTFKNAVDRNRAKRRFRSSVKELIKDFPNGHQFIFILKRETLTAPYADMREDVAHMLTKIEKTMQRPLKLSPRAKKEISKGKLARGARFVRPKRKKV
ncbi:ribonuclease P protein component [Candidatus Uhrbacteria bacterium]|nr:ribonuclease P protein component [Candidatus Uhrbacteria bacterium]